MSYITQDEKKKIAPVVKEILKKNGLKGTLSIHNHSTLVLTIKSGNIDFIGNYNETVAARPGSFRNGNPVKGNMEVNPYHFETHFSGKAQEVIAELIPALKGENWYDRSDSQSDYFDTKHYVSVSVGRWDQDYVLEV
jgi:hypothetical protein